MQERTAILSYGPKYCNIPHPTAGDVKWHHFSLTLTSRVDWAYPDLTFLSQWQHFSGPHVLCIFAVKGFMSFRASWTYTFALTLLKIRVAFERLPVTLLSWIPVPETNFQWLQNVMNAFKKNPKNAQGKANAQNPKKCK